ncbi:MAG TPA: hypothetical protein VMU34_19740 [Mycobacterium sp.]|nr:hypothetical protein [Mycobacterium sp.]
MDAMLGFATTRTTVGFVLVEGSEADGAAVECGSFRVQTAGGATAFHADEQVDAYKQMANRVWLRMRTIAATRRVRSVGLTCSDDAGREASLLRESLTDAGLGNVVAVGLPEVANALARVSGYEKTAVCVSEPETVAASVGAVTVRQVRGGADELIRWLCEVFDQDDWNADGLIVAGPDAITSQLRQSLPVAVCAPEQALSALALGAAQAAADSQSAKQSVRERRPWSLSHTRAMLLTGVLALIVLLSLGVGPPPAQNKAPTPAGDPQVANTSGRPPAVAPVTPSVATPVQQVQAPPADPPLAPAPQDTPPARSVPKPPASLPTTVPDQPPPPVPPPPELSQVPPAIPTPPPDCLLLCRIAI